MEKQNSNRAERSTRDRWGLYHIYYKRTGFYQFLSKNLLKLAVIIVAFIGIFLVLDSAFDVDNFLTKVLDTMPVLVILSIFTVSETLLGLVPPDLFILWCKATPQPWLMLTALAVLSYLGGVGAYGIGLGLRNLPTINNYVSEKYAKEMKMLSRWGGFFIIIAALLPLPFAVISTLVGVIRYDFKHFLAFGLFRLLRFFAYALVLFQL